ncbi:AGD9 [Symbiodinium sp. CCMP2592]|nr:AGD9 [Symbiodinium sp. CCMP2592]
MSQANGPGDGAGQQKVLEQASQASSNNSNSNNNSNLQQQAESFVDRIVKQRLEQAFTNMSGKLVESSERAARAAEQQAGSQRSDNMVRSLKVDAWKPQGREEELRTWREWNIDLDTEVDHALLPDAMVQRSLEQSKSGYEAHEHLIRYEEALRAYEAASGKEFSKDLVLATVLTGLWEPLKSQVQFRMVHRILQYEALNTPWGTVAGGQSKGGGGKFDDGGQQAMEVDRTWGGKSKGKDGKGKRRRTPRASTGCRSSRSRQEASKIISELDEDLGGPRDVLALFHVVKDILSKPARVFDNSANDLAGPYVPAVEEACDEPDGGLDPSERMAVDGREVEEPSVPEGDHLKAWLPALTRP